MTLYCSSAVTSAMQSLVQQNAKKYCNSNHQEGLAVASIARDHPSTLPGDYHSPRAH